MFLGLHSRIRSFTSRNPPLNSSSSSPTSSSPALQAPMYFDIIKEPMDLQTIKNNLDENVYVTKEEFAADLYKMCDNCRTYNDPKTEYFHMGVRIEVGCSPLRPGSRSCCPRSHLTGDVRPPRSNTLIAA